jgi:hypothetical protein
MPRRKEESRRRSPPSQSSLRGSGRDYPSRRRSRSRSLSRERSRNAVNNGAPKKVESLLAPENRISKSPELRPVPGVDDQVLEKRRRKFQDRAPIQKQEGKKIRLHQAKQQEENESKRSSSPDTTRRPSFKPISKPKSETSPQNKRSESPTSIKVKIDQDSEPEQEDLRAKLIKKKMKAQQQGHHVGSGRIFSEALKGTRLISKSSSDSKSSSRPPSTSTTSSNRSSNKERSLKRKVSLTYA